MEGKGKKTSVASDQPDGEAQPLEEKYKERCNWAGEKDFHDFFVFFLFVTQRGKRRFE